MSMELTNRRFAIFLSSGLALAVVVGLLVWKISDTGAHLHSEETEFAGQPVVAADSSSSEMTASEPSTEESTTSIENEGDGDEAQAAPANNGAGGAGYDPLAPRNANLNGNRGGDQDVSYYRPTNVAPAPQGINPKTTAQPTQQPNEGSEGTSTQPGTSPQPTQPQDNTTTTVVPAEPQSGEEQAEKDINPDLLNQQQGTNPKAPQAFEEKAQQAADAAKEGLPQNKPRPEDPFSASTRVPQVPNEQKAQAAGANNPAENSSQ